MHAVYCRLAHVRTQNGLNYYSNRYKSTYTYICILEYCILLIKLLKSEDSAVVSAILNAFQQIIDCLMKVVLALDEQG